MSPYQCRDQTTTYGNVLSFYPFACDMSGADKTIKTSSWQETVNGSLKGRQKVKGAACDFYACQDSGTLSLVFCLSCRAIQGETEDKLPSNSKVL